MTSTPSRPTSPDDEEAKEYVGDGRHRGALSFFLGDALKSAAGVPTYRDRFARASALVANQVANQPPQLEATRNDDLDGVFLDGAIQPAPTTFTASCRECRWTINGGQTMAFRHPQVLTLPGSPSSHSTPPPTNSATRPGRWQPPSWKKSSLRPAGLPSRATSNSTRVRSKRPSSSACRRPHWPSGWKGTRRPANGSARWWTSHLLKESPRSSFVSLMKGKTPNFA